MRFGRAGREVRKMDEKIVIIGMGSLMTLIAPSYSALLGERLKTDLIATTVDEEDRKRKQAMFPFEIRLGDNAGALRDLEPTMILFAPPPHVAVSIAQNDLAPYYAELREKGKPLPLLLATPPVPDVEKYFDILGEDIPVATMLPNTFAELNGKKVDREGANMVTLSNVHPLSEEDKARVKALLDPIGQTIFSKPQYSLKILTAGVELTSITAFMKDIADNCPYAMTIQQVAAGVRLGLRKKFDIRYGGDVPSDDCLPKWQLGSLDRFIDSFTDGIIKYLKEVEIPDYAAVSIMGDMNLHITMMLTREQIERQMAGMATPGGMLEKAVKDYEAFMREEMIAESKALAPDHPFSEEFLADIAEFTRKTSHAVLDHAMGLAK